MVAGGFMMFMKNMSMDISSTRGRAQRDFALRTLQDAINNPGNLRASFDQYVATGTVHHFRNCIEAGGPNNCVEGNFPGFSGLREMAMACLGAAGAVPPPAACAAIVTSQYEFDLLDSQGQRVAGRYTGGIAGRVRYTAEGRRCDPGDPLPMCPFEALAFFNPQCAGATTCAQATNVETIVLLRPTIDGAGNPVVAANNRGPARIVASADAAIDTARIVSLNTSCAGGLLFTGTDANGNAICQPASSNCPPGQRVQDVDFGARTVGCTETPAAAGPGRIGIVPLDCGAGRYVRGIDGNGNLICETLPTPPPPPSLPTVTCPPRQAVTGIDSGGNAICGPTGSGGYMESYEPGRCFFPNPATGACSCPGGTVPAQVFDFGTAAPCGYYGPPLANPVNIGGNLVCGARGFTCVPN